MMAIAKPAQNASASLARRFPVCSLLVLLVSLASCAGPRVEIPTQAWNTETSEDFRVPQSIAMGFDALLPGIPALDGDRTLVATRLYSPGAERLLFVRVTRLGPPRKRGGSTSMEMHTGDLDFRIAFGLAKSRMLVEIFDQDGQLIASREREALALNTIEQDVLVASTPGLLSPLLELISDTPELESFMKEVIALPSLLSLVRHGGLRTIVTLDFSTEFRTRSMHGPLEVYGDRLTIEANGTLALDARAFHTWRQSPLLLTAGIIRVEGHHPTDPERRVVLEVVGAERGGDPRSPSE